MRQFSFACIGFCLLTTISHAEEGVYIVTYVYDGDTIKLHPIDSNNPYDELKFRLADIDAPERNQAYGLKSRRVLMNLCQGKSIIATAQISGTDQYHRSLGKLQCNGTDASMYLVENGWAWHYVPYSNNTLLHNAELNAHQQNQGLWEDNNPTPPWIWRKTHQQNAFKPPLPQQKY